MNRRVGYSSSSRDSGYRQSWRSSSDSSPHSHTSLQADTSSVGSTSDSLYRTAQNSWQGKHQYSTGDVQNSESVNSSVSVRRVQARDDASSNRRVSSSLDKNQHGSWQVKGCKSDDFEPRNHEHVTFGRHQSEQHGSATFRGRNLHGSWQVKGCNSDGFKPRNHGHVTLGRHQDERHESSTFRGGNLCNEDGAKKWGISSKASNTTADSSHDKQCESMPFESKGSIDLDHSFIQSIDLPAKVTCRSVSHSGSEASVSTQKEHTNEKAEHVDCSTQVEGFDVCPPKSDSLFTLKPSLFSKNREKRNEMKKSDGIILRPGMVLLKRYLSISEQVKILNICRNEGLRPAGFFQPGYRDGEKLHLKMMCFGEFWDPETGKYGKFRPSDGAKPPSVPYDLLKFVERAIKECQALIAGHSRVNNVEDILPSVKPDICLVNYYAASGRLGLHQDKDESQESIDKGIPIVSFSIGDTAEFLYGDQRDVENASKVKLESGDVLIFGGKSRNIFHGVSTIKLKTAPSSLLEETNFRPGRLNLTFRQL